MSSWTFEKFETTAFRPSILGAGTRRGYSNLVLACGSRTPSCCGKALLKAVVERRNELRSVGADAYGERFVLDFEMTTSTGRATVRSGWIILAGEQTLPFVTCYVLK